MINSAHNLIKENFLKCISVRKDFCWELFSEEIIEYPVMMNEVVERIIVAIKF
jgi:hypothetical protein